MRKNLPERIFLPACTVINPLYQASNCVHKIQSKKLNPKNQNPITAPTQTMKLLGISVLTLLPSAKACSRVFQNKWDMKVSGRSMDWDHSFDDVLFINPRGMKMDGGSTENPVEWESKYGSVTASVIGYFAPQPECASLDFYLDGSTDGVNEKGLAAHVLYLGEEDGTVYGTPTPEKKNIHYFRWVRYVLDNYATVEEAIEGLSSVVTTNANICPGYTEDGEGKELGAHMAIEDASGDSAVFEHVGGVLQVYHNKNDTLVMTNEPPFDQHRIILADYEPWGGNITLPDNLPGSVASEDRFIRLEYYLKYTPEPKTEVEGVANIMSLISATNVPFGAPYGGRL